MKALLLDSPSGISLRDIEKPSPKDGEVLVKMRACGICGSDVQKAKGLGTTSRIIGHEVVGEVAGLGTNVEGIGVGDRVFTHNQTPCYSCILCKRGAHTLCAEFRKSNLTPGGFAEYYIVPEYNVSRGAVLKLPDGLGYEEASFIEPLACCVRALRGVDFKLVSRVLIFGVGPIGLLYLKLLRHYGARHVEFAEVSAGRLEFGRRMGAEETFNPASEADRTRMLERPEEERPELVIVATGNTSAFQDGVRAVAKGGQVLLFGSPPRGAKAELDMERLFLGNLSIITSYSSTEKETAIATDMLGRSSISVSELITHRFPLSESVQAFRAAEEQQQCIKAVIVD